jgi:pilus assembly protein FimV
LLIENSANRLRQTGPCDDAHSAPMIARFQSLRCRAVTAAILLIVAQTCAAQGTAASVTAAASAAAVAGAPSAASQVTVQPGESLNDVAIAITQSHDRAVLSRAARAIFDANPGAFMKNDPSRMKLGSVLNVPALDSTGAVAAGASSAEAATAAPASAPAGAASAAAVAGNAASTTTAAAMAAAPSSGASAAQEAREQAGAAASGPTATATSAGASIAAAASAPANASAPASASLPVVQAAGASGSQATAASSGNVWSGSIQSAPSQPAGVNGAQVASAGAPQGASQAHPQVSSLQQLLALKNRVLMELQKHGIGKPAGTQQAASGVAAANGQLPAQTGAGASAVSGSAAAAAHPPAAPVSSQQQAEPAAMSRQQYVTAAALVGAVLAALVAGLAMRRRKRGAAAAAAGAGSASGRTAADDAPPAPDTTAAVETGRRAASAYDAMARSDEPAASHESLEDDADEVPSLSERVTPAADIAAAPAAPDAEAARDEPSELTHEPQAHEPQAHEPYTGDHVSVSEAAPTERIEDEAPPVGTEAHTPLEEPAGPAPELPPDVAAPADTEHAVADGSSESEPAIEPVAAEPANADADAPQAHAESPEPAEQQTQELAGHEPDENRATLPQFPRAALDALDSLDMSLPPRTDSDAPVVPPASLTTQPVVEPNITAQQAVPPHEPEPPRVGEQIEAGTAGHGAIAGMGAAKYGPLALDFDLELPPGPAQPLPTFTPEELARIARNKLELAAEYIELGDVAGARTLINEVIESNDAATRNDARAMLSTLAPLS